MVYILYNPTSSEGNAREYVNDAVAKFAGEKVETKSVFDVGDYKDFFSGISKEDKVVFLGGDGTLNCFLNSMKGTKIENEIYLFKAGTGNDFLRDIYDGVPEDGTMIQINEYIDNLPVVTINGKDYLFLNGIGFGLDGKCCSVADDLKAEGKTNINYTAIAIKLMAFQYKPTNATVIVDGVETKYNKVWISPIMNGRYYGGGMKVTPDQDRKSDEISTCIFFGTGKLKTLMYFPKIFEGTHVNIKNYIKVMSGKEITIRLEQPQDAQIDGETIRDVLEISARKYSNVE